MCDSFYADTVRLALHRDFLLRERRIVQQIHEALSRARQSALPEEAPAFDRLLERCERLSAYFRAMADQLDLMVAELERLSLDISLLLRDARGYTRER